jgi:hypothetical protein
MLDEAGEQAAAVGAAHDVFDVVFRMRILWLSSTAPSAEQ